MARGPGTFSCMPCRWGPLDWSNPSQHTSSCQSMQALLYNSEQPPVGCGLGDCCRVKCCIFPAHAVVVTPTLLHSFTVSHSAHLLCTGLPVTPKLGLTVSPGSPFHRLDLSYCPLCSVGTTRWRRAIRACQVREHPLLSKLGQAIRVASIVYLCALIGHGENHTRLMRLPKMPIS